MKIAFVKLDSLPDLWIGNHNSTIQNLIFSSQMRIGPVGLFDQFDCDYYVVKSKSNSDLLRYQSSQISLTAEDVFIISSSRGLMNKPSRLDADKCYSLTHGQFSFDQEDINLSQYDCIITVNLVFTKEYIRNFVNTIFILLPSEGRLPFQLPKYYSFIINHKPTHYLDTFPSPIFSFPFSFLLPNQLSNLFIKLDQNKSKVALYSEINNSLARPVKRADLYPLQLICSRHNFQLCIHSSSIAENLSRLKRAKYFVKYRGRPIRGNSVYEAVSMGCLVLLKRNSCFDSLPIPTECYFDSLESLEAKILHFESNPIAFNRTLAKQNSAFLRSISYGCLGLRSRVRLASFFKAVYLYWLFNILNRFIYFLQLSIHHITFRFQQLLP